MRENLKALAKARQEYLEAQGARQAALNAFWNIEENAALIVAEREAKEACQRADEDLRKAALEQYKQDGEKKCDGYSIKLVKDVLIPDPKKAVEWCISNFTPALKLDTNLFEKAAKDGSIPDDLASVIEEPTPYVDKDIERFLRE